MKVYVCEIYYKNFIGKFFSLSNLNINSSNDQLKKYINKVIKLFF